MNKNISFIVFVIVVVVHLISVLLGYTVIGSITKILLIPTLAIWLLEGLKNHSIFLLLALLFSWFGDILLVFQQRPVFFLLGLSTFLMAHIFYIITFYKTTRTSHRNLPYSFSIAIVIIAYIIGFLSLIGPTLGEMKVAVYLYAIVISLMLGIALNRYKKTNPKSFFFIASGALLFVFSDSMIAWNKFVDPFQNADFFIMITYIAAQTLIVSGVLKHPKFS